MIEFREEPAGRVPDHGFTHAAKFHADDVFSTAFLQLLNPNFQVRRGLCVPRDFDGIVYDIGRGRFDHHQEDKESRENGIPYAAFGLLWREYGTLLLTETEAAEFDERFVRPLDESDNTGCDNVLADVIDKFNPLWDEEQDYEERFRQAVAFAGQILANEISSIQGLRRAAGIVRQAMEQGDGKMLILPCYLPWKKMVIGSGYRFAIYPSNRGGYSVQGVPVSEREQTLVCEFPREWWGKEPEELQRLSGIKTIRFCHATGFLASADTKEDAEALARIALERGQKN